MSCTSNNKYLNLSNKIFKNDLALFLEQALNNIAKHAPYYTSNEGLKYLIPVEPTHTPPQT